MSRIARSWMALGALLAGACGSGDPVAGLGPIPTGSLTLGIDGLPPGVLGAVVVTGSQGYQKNLTTGQTLAGLTPGGYAIAASEITSDGDRYTPAPATQNVAVTSGSSPVTASVSYELVTGRLAVSVSGLPAGVNATIQVSGPAGYAHTVLASETISGLAPGTYTVQSPTLVVSGDRYDAQTASQELVVAAIQGTTALVAVSYSVASGALSIVVGGLPAGANAAIGVTGPQGFHADVAASATLSGLVPGNYSLSAGNVSAGGVLYVPSLTEQSAAVPASLVPVIRTVSYTQAIGALSVTLAGLPGSVPGSVTVSGPGGFLQNITATQTLTGLVPGTYLVSAFSVSSGGTTYNPVTASQNVPVGIGSTASAGVDYAPVTGSLQLTVSGLPGGVPGAVSVTGPGFSQQFTGTQTLTGLLPGTYAISAVAVSWGGSSYLPVPLSQTSSVSGGALAGVTVVYASSAGSLNVTIGGLPGGVLSNVTVAGPAGFSQILTASQTLTGLIPGSYTISAAAVSSGGSTYLPVPVSQSRSVSGGTVVSVTVIYASSTGSLNLTIGGLPGGALANVTVTGPGGFSQFLTASQTLTGLVPGSYTVSSVAVVSGGTTYSPSPANQSVSVSAGTVAPASVFYAAGGGGATLNLTISGVYLTQATQRPDGSVPLVAGRNAYLRVFTLANESNSVQPQVRVRLYNGAVLVQTYTITAPAGSVPLVVNESSLTSSWNVLVPGALVQPNLKVLADVDPTAVTAESDESDNQFPVSGVPGAVDVRSLPSFQLRFVPVLQQVNGLQGNVTAGNTESFLAVLKQQLPVGAYNADVRAPYSTTAPVLENNNGNGAWGTILSEMLAVRAGDASTRYYYGVVKTTYGSGVAGMGYVGGGARSAIGWDYLPSGSGVMAHELGHNMDRQHAPCGGVAGPDPGYPYAGGLIGMWGLDLTTLTLKSPATFADLMGYCNPSWVSDYNWSAMVTYRQSGPNNAPPVDDGGAGLLVWGRITDFGVVLEPAFRLPSAAGRAPTPGANRLELLAADGSLLRTVQFETDDVADLPGGTERHFAFVIPLDAATERDLSGLRVRAGTRAAARLAPLAAADPRPALTRANSQQVDMRWDAAHYPMVMVRDAVTGDILSFARGGSARLWTRSSNFMLHFSDGVKSVVRQDRTLQ